MKRTSHGLDGLYGSSRFKFTGFLLYPILSAKSVSSVRKKEVLLFVNLNAKFFKLPHGLDGLDGSSRFKIKSLFALSDFIREIRVPKM